MLFAVRAQQKLEYQNGRVPSLFDAPVAIKPALTVLAAVLPLPPALAQWATAMEPLAKRHAGGARPASRAIVYIVRAQAPSGAARMSKKRPVASLADPGCGVRLFVEAVEVGLDENGNAIGSGSKVVSIGLYPGQAGPAHIDEEDRLITRRLQLRVGDTDHENCLTGLGGSDLFERILRTGRARWGDLRDECCINTPKWKPDWSGGTMTSAAPGWRCTGLHRTAWSLWQRRRS